MLGTACGLLGDACGSAELARREADDALEVLGELALIRKADARRDLGQGEVLVGVQELLRPCDAARDDVLVRRHAGGRFELPREVVGAAVGGRGQLRQGQVGVEVFLDVRDDSTEFAPRQRAVPPARRPVGRQDLAEQLDGQDIGQGLGSQPPASGARGQLSIHRQHRGPQGRQVQAVERRDRQPRRVEVERLGGDSLDQPWL
jgi:hypothetical protein